MLILSGPVALAGFRVLSFFIQLAYFVCGSNLVGASFSAGVEKTRELLVQ